MNFLINKFTNMKSFLISCVLICGLKKMITNFYALVILL